MINRVIFNVGVYKIIGLGLSFLFTIFITKYLGNEISGKYFQYVASISIFSTAIGAALQNYSIKKVSYLYKENDSIDPILWFSLGVILLISFFIWFVSSQFEYSKELLAFDSGNYYLVSIVSTTLLLTFIGILRGIGDIHKAQFVENILKPLLLFVFVFLSWKFNGYSHELIYLFSMCICATVVIALTLIKIPTPKLQGVFSTVLNLGGNVKDVSELFLLSTISAFQKNLDIIIVGLVLSSSDVGYYKLAVVCSTLITLGVLVSNYYYASKFSVLYKESKFGELQSLVCKGSKLSFYLGGVILLVLILVTPFIFKYSYSSDWIIAYKLFLILSVGKLADSYFGSVTVFANMTGNSNIVSICMFISLLIMFTLSLVLSKEYGVLGIAFSVSFSFFSWNFLASYMLNKKTRIQFGAYCHE